MSEKIISTEVKHPHSRCPGTIVAKVDYPPPSNDGNFRVGLDDEEMLSPPHLMVHYFYCNKCGVEFKFVPGKPKAAESILQKLRDDWYAEQGRNWSTASQKMLNAMSPEKRKEYMGLTKKLAARLLEDMAKGSKPRQNGPMLPPTHHSHRRKNTDT